MSATRPTERDVMSADFDLALEEYLYTLTDEEFELSSHEPSHATASQTQSRILRCRRSERRFGKGTK